jgi:hypothetical protein
MSREVFKVSVGGQIEEMALPEPERHYREFTITGKVYSGNESHAEWLLYWAIRNSEADSEILIDKITIGGKE